MIDVGDICIYCDQSTSLGSGLFVDRIPADDGERDGWMCAECQFPEVCFSCEEEEPMEGEMLCKSCHHGGEEERPLSNTEENRLRLAKAVWETLTLDDLFEQFIYQQCKRYEEIDGVFEEDAELMDLEDGGEE